MSSDSIKPIIFISYAHLDEPEKPRGEEIQWLTFVMKFLRPAVKSGEFRIWVDRQMQGGTKWDQEIEGHLLACNIFVLLVSANSMGSDYIIDKELEIARRRQTDGDLHVYPLLIEPTPRAGLKRVQDFNLRPRDAKPLQSYPLAERNQHMSDAADEIAEIAEAIEEGKPPRPEERILVAPRSPGGSVCYRLRGWKRILRAAESREQLRGRHQRSAGNRLRAAGRARRRACAPRRSVERRQDQHPLAHRRGRGGQVGSGQRMADAAPRRQLSRRECVLGWSFYSQGSKERATAADEFLDWALDKLGVKIETTSASAKGEAIAEALIKRRVLLVLDGVEPLQHGPGPQVGQLKDQGLRALLRRFVASARRPEHSLIVLTSRIAVADIQRSKDGAAPVVDVERLSEEAGADTPARQRRLGDRQGAKSGLA